MRKSLICVTMFVLCAGSVSSKDKTRKVTVREMALGMRDAFNCGVIVEEHLHGKLKGDDNLYHQQQDKYNCAHVQDVLGTLDDQNGTTPSDK